MISFTKYVDHAPKSDLEAIVFYAHGEHGDTHQGYRLACSLLHQSFYRSITWADYRAIVRSLESEGVMDCR